MTTTATAKVTKDPNVFIPENVAAASKKADELISSLKNPPGDRSPEPQQDGKQPSTATTTQSAEQGKKAEPGGDKKGQPASASAQPDGKDQKGQSTDHQPAEGDLKAQKDTQYYKRRFEVIQGKYNAEVPRLHANIQELEATVASLQQQLKQLQGGTQDDGDAEAGSATGGDASVDATLSLNPDDLSDYGEEFVVLAKRNQQLEQELAELKRQLGSVKETQETSAAQRFWTRLTELCPDWEAVNEDQAFIAYLNTTLHPYTGRPIQEALNDAVAQQDAERVARIFNDWIQGQQGQQRQQQTPAPESQTQQRQPAGMNIQPSVRRSDVGQSSENTRTWTPSQIREHYAQKTRGEWLGREDEWKALERDLIAAQTEGRIRPE